MNNYCSWCSAPETKCPHWIGLYLTCGHTASGWEEGEAEEEWNTKGPDEWELRWWKKKCDM